MWFKKIFGKKDVIEAPVATSKRVTVLEAEALLRDRLAVDEKAALTAVTELRDGLVQSIDELRRVIVELSAADVSEPKATASRVIKDGFVQRAQTALARIDIPVWSKLNELQTNLIAVESALGSVAVGPREAMHMKFFFDNQMAGIASGLHGAFNTISLIRGRIAPAVDKRKQFGKLLNDIAECKNSISDKHERIEQAEREMADAKRSITAIEVHDLSELQRLRDEYSRMQHSLAELDQQTLSGLTPAVRLLKRYVHSTTDKHSEELIRKFEVDPANVFYENDERVKAALAAAIAAVRSGQISAEEKEIVRAEGVLSRFSDLQMLCGRHSELAAKQRELSSIIDRESAKERENAAASDRVGLVEGEVAQTEMHVLNFKREISDAESRLTELKKKLGEQLSSLGESIEVVD